MEFFNRRKKTIGFTILELIVVFSIIALIFTFGIAYWKKYQVQKRFVADFDNLVATLNEAQVSAKAYGKDPTGYATTGTAKNAQLRDKYVCVLARKGMNQTDRIETMTSVKITSTATVYPMTQVKLRDEFKGVSLNFGYKSGASADDYTYDFCFLYEPDGTLFFPAGYAYEEVRLDVEGDSGRMLKRIYINQLTGRIRTEDVR